LLVSDSQRTPITLMAEKISIRTAATPYPSGVSTTWWDTVTFSPGM